MSCQCPEVHDGREWRPQCEALEAGSLASAEAEGPEPRSWRCPRCGGGYQAYGATVLREAITSRTASAMKATDIAIAKRRCIHLRCGAVAPGFYCGPPPVYSALNRS